MSRYTERELDTLLLSRSQHPAHEDLARRIIEATHSHKQNAGSVGMQWLYGVFSGYFRFEPTYVLVLFLVLGLNQGFIVTGAVAKHRSDVFQIEHSQDFFYSTRSYL
jgi:hypothetical protein